MKKRPRFTLGILGGMGPLAGVELHRRIVLRTPAASDQEHVPVILYTNPHIPDRTASLATDGGHTYTISLAAMGKRLADAGATHLIMACNTAHARHAELAALLPVPLLHFVDLAVAELVERTSAHPVSSVKHAGQPLLILGTTVTREHRLWSERLAAAGIPHEELPARKQRQMDEIIWGVKSGESPRSHAPTLAAWATEGNKKRTLLAACTELSLVAETMKGSGTPIVDATDLVADAIVKMAK